jgi:hypothetical protein
VEGAGFTVAEEVVLQGQPVITSHVTALSGDVLQVGRDSIVDPQLDDAIHPVPRRNTNVRGVHQHVIEEGVTLEGEPYIVVPPGVVHGGEVQCDRDERTDVLHASGLDVDIGDDDGLVVAVQWSSTTDGGQGRRRGSGLNQDYRGVSLIDEDGSCALLLLQERGGSEDLGVGGVVPFLHVNGGGDHYVKFLSELGNLALYHFFTLTAAVTIASSFFQNSATWQSSSVAIVDGGAAHQEVVRLTGDAAEGERAAGPWV